MEEDADACAAFAKAAGESEFRRKVGTAEGGVDGAEAELFWELSADDDGFLPCMGDEGTEGYMANG